MSYAERTARPPRTLTDREVKKILKVTGEAKSGFRDHMIISLALGCALRQSEIVGLNVEDVAGPDGLEPKRAIQLRVFKRGGKYGGTDPDFQRVHVPPATFYKLKKWLRSEWKDRTPSKGTPLFVATHGNVTGPAGRRLSSRSVREMWQTWQRRAGFERHYNFHILRHTSISNIRRSTGDIRIAQRVARHVNIATTVRYDHVADEEIVQAIKGVIA